MGVIEGLSWVVIAAGVGWLVASLAWRWLRAPALEVAATLLIFVLEQVRRLLVRGSPDVLGGPTAGGGGGSVDALAAVLIERLKAAQDDLPAVGPEQGLISWNLPQTLSTALWREVQVRISRGSMHTAEHRVGLRGGPPAFTRTLTVGTRMAVRLHTTDPALEIDDPQGAANERDLPERGPRHWEFRIRSNAKGWREVSLIATPVKPVLGDQFLERRAVRLTHTRFGAWYASLPFSIKGAGWTAACGALGLIGVSEIAKPYVQEPVRAAVERVFGPPPGAASEEPMASPPATGEDGPERAAGDD